MQTFEPNLGQFGPPTNHPNDPRNGEELDMQYITEATYKSTISYPIITLCDEEWIIGPEDQYELFEHYLNFDYVYFWYVNGHFDEDKFDMDYAMEKFAEELSEVTHLKPSEIMDAKFYPIH